MTPQFEELLVSIEAYLKAKEKFRNLVSYDVGVDRAAQELTSTQQRAFEAFEEAVREAQRG